MATTCETRIAPRKQIKLQSSKAPAIVCLIFSDNPIGAVERSVFEECWNDEDVRIQLTKWVGGLDLPKTAFRSLDGAMLELLSSGIIHFDDFEITYDRAASSKMPLSG